MKSRREIVSVDVSRHKIAWMRDKISAFEGYKRREDPKDNKSYYIELIPANYRNLFDGEVFIPYDENDEYFFDDPSCYLMKRKDCNWYLTGDEDSPLGVDDNIKYGMVWLVN